VNEGLGKTVARPTSLGDLLVEIILGSQPDKGPQWDVCVALFLFDV